MSPRMGRTGGAAARGFGKGTAVRGPRGIPSVVSATAVGTVENASNGKLNLTWTNTDATAQTRIYNGATLLATENAGTTTKSLTTLNANTAYTLTVKHFKDSIESAGANFSSATTYHYNGFETATACGASAGAHGYDNHNLYSVVADGNNGPTSLRAKEAMSTSCGVYLRLTEHTGESQLDNVGFTTPSSGTTQLVVFAAGAGGGAGDTRGGAAGGAVYGAVWNVPADQNWGYSVGAGGISATNLAEGGDFGIGGQTYLNLAGALRLQCAGGSGAGSDGGTATAGGDNRNDITYITGSITNGGGGGGAGSAALGGGTQGNPSVLTFYFDSDGRGVQTQSWGGGGASQSDGPAPAKGRGGSIVVIFR